jgi:hypothetical protein
MEFTPKPGVIPELLQNLSHAGMKAFEHNGLVYALIGNKDVPWLQTGGTNVKVSSSVEQKIGQFVEQVAWIDKPQGGINKMPLTRHDRVYWKTGEGAEILAQVREGKLTHTEAAARAGVSSSYLYLLVPATDIKKPLNSSAAPQPSIQMRHVPVEHQERSLKGTRLPTGGVPEGKTKRQYRRRGESLSRKEGVPSDTPPLGIAGLDVKVLVKVNGQEATIGEFLSFVKRLALIGDALKHLGLN